MRDQDTIAAIATPVGTAGIGVVRISGPGAAATAGRISRHSGGIHPRTAHYGTLVHPQTGEAVDDVVLTLFAAPHSYTGEDVVEISCHGSIVVLKAALGAALDAGARLAEPGEFTKRAFLNGRIDLTQAEAVNDLIRSTTDSSRKVALRQLEGRLSQRVSGAAARILGVLAAIEAAIDFPDDVPEPDNAWLAQEISAVRESITELASTFEGGRIYREGLRMVIAGRVNVGKSSLMNALLRHARAIVTPIPGTTRDVIEESLQIRGIPIVAIDTAGLRETQDPVERIGVELTEHSLQTADLVLCVLDASSGVSDDDAELVRRVGDRRAVLVINKTDLVPEDERAALAARASALLPKVPAAEVSAATGAGMDALEEMIAGIAASGGAAAEGDVVSNIRHQRLLLSARESLERALETAEAAAPIDLLSVDLQAARSDLGLITGETASEDLVDRIFSEFCIGK